MSCSSFTKHASGSGGTLQREKSRQIGWLEFLASLVIAILFYRKRDSVKLVTTEKLSNLKWQQKFCFGLFLLSIPFSAFTAVTSGRPSDVPLFTVSPNLNTASCDIQGVGDVNQGSGMATTAAMVPCMGNGNTIGSSVACFNAYPASISIPTFLLGSTLNIGVLYYKKVGSNYQRYPGWFTIDRNCNATNFYYDSCLESTIVVGQTSGGTNCPTTSTTGCDVTTMVGMGGNISPAGVTHLDCGTSRTFSITPNTGYRITNVLLDNSSIGAISSYALSCSCTNGSSQYCTTGNVNINNMSTNCINGICTNTGVKITCNTSSCSACNANGCSNILYNGVTSISGGSINCSNGRCNYSVQNGGSSSSGSFSCGNGSTTNVLKKQTIEARFEVLANPTLNVFISGNGSVSGNGISCGADCSESYAFNTPVTLTANPTSGSVFSSWSGSCSGTSPTTTVTMDATKTCIANFSSSVATCPSASNPMKVKVWVDKNGSKSYNAGEEVSGALVSINNNSGLTSSSGIIQISQASPTDKIYAEKTFFSVGNVKAVDSNFGGAAYNPYAVSGVDRNAYTFVMSSDVMRKLDGYYFDFPSNAPLCGSGSIPLQKDSQGNVLIQLVHPKIEWNLVVAFEQAQSLSFYDQVRAGFRSYADYMYNYTDGYSVVKNVVFVNGRYAGSPQWNYSDVQVKNSEWPNAHVFGNRHNGPYHIHMGKTWSGHGPTGYNWYSTLGHESGHYLFGFYDEYLSGNSKQVNNGTWTYRITHPNEFPKNYGVMESQYNGVHELSDTTDYFPRSTYSLDQVTMQYNLNGKKSTWDFLRTTYQNEIQNKLSSQGFSSAFFANLILPPHLVGNYPYSDSTKRNGPDRMNHDSITFRKADREEARTQVNFIEWTTPDNTKASEQEPLFDAIVQVVDSSGVPIPQAEVWLVSAEGIKHFQGKTNNDGVVISNSVGLGKRLEVYSEGRKTELTVTEESNYYLLALSSRGVREGEKSENGLIVSARLDETQPSKLVIGVSGNLLASQPSVTLSQPESYVANVPMESQANDAYAGLVESQYSSGTVEVVSGDSQSISAFEMFSTEVPLASGFPAPNGELLMVTTPESFVGSGEFIITTSTALAPANGDLVQVGNVWSFAFANSISAVHNVGFEILLSADRMKGLDATQLNLYGWDALTKTWQLIAGGNTRDLRGFNITLASLDYVSYALFAPTSEDMVAPNAITDLQASTGDSKWRINLQWTAANDDRGIYLYEIRFNTVPVTEANWNDSFAVRTIPNETNFVMEMPDPNKDYYFAILAADAASNWSPIVTLDTPTKSQSSDTDEDGMLDQWEMEYFGDLSHDGTADTDSDLFTDLEEFEAGTDPTVSSVIGAYSATGQILDAQGHPIADVTVQIGDKTAVSNASGYWEINGLVENTYTVAFAKDGLTFLPQNFELGNGQNVELNVSPVTSLKAQVTPNRLGAIPQGENLSYTITVLNGGEVMATGIKLTVSIPQGTNLVALAGEGETSCDLATAICTVPDLLPGTSTKLTLELGNLPSSGIAFVNQVSLTSNEYPVDVAKTWSKVKPYLSLLGKGVPNPVEIGQQLHYILKAELLNNSPNSTAQDVVAEVALSPEVKFLNATATQGTCGLEGNKVICRLGHLSVANSDDVSNITINVDVELVDLYLLQTNAETRVYASNFPEHREVVRTALHLGDTKVDGAILLDVTGSMGEELQAVIKAVKQQLTQKYTGGKKPMIALVTFRDSVRLEAAPTDLNVLLKALNKLEAKGGGLCAEASAEALELALNHVKPGGVIIFASDAPPYDGTDIAALKAKIAAKNATFIPILTQSPDCAANELTQ